MRFNPELKLGDLLTALSVLVATVSLVTVWIKDRRLREKEYADRVRTAASQALVALERWHELASCLFDEVETLLTDADVLLVTKRDVVETRDALWRGLVRAMAEAKRRTVDANLGGAYVDLYGYDPRVHDRYHTALADIRSARADAYLSLLAQTQDDVLSFENGHAAVESAALGNRLRDTAGKVREAFEQRTARTLSSFRQVMFSLVSASDLAIVRKRVAAG